MVLPVRQGGRADSVCMEERWRGQRRLWATTSSQTVSASRQVQSPFREQKGRRTTRATAPEKRHAPRPEMHLSKPEVTCVLSSSAEVDVSKGGASEDEGDMLLLFGLILVGLGEEARM